ncbi:MAG: hypothetical protein QXZ70_07785 [Candidatus Bathyarchaeia archaeon]
MEVITSIETTKTEEEFTKERLKKEKNAETAMCIAPFQRTFGKLNHDLTIALSFSKKGKGLDFKNFISIPL